MAQLSRQPHSGACSAVLQAILSLGPMDFSDTRYAVRIVLLSSVVEVTTPNMLWSYILILFALSP